MFRYSVVLLLLIIGFPLSQSFAEEPDSALIPMPKGFEGIHVGMTIKELLKIRPNADVPPAYEYPPSQQMDTTKLNQTLQEGSEIDSVYGLRTTSMYVFRDGRLKNVTIIWSGDIKQIRNHREAFILSCTKMWGHEYDRRILKLEPKTANEHLAPLLSWEKNNAMIAALCPSEYEGKSLKEGAFVISMFSKNDREAMDALSGERVDEKTRDKLFLKIGIPPQDTSSARKE